MVGSVIPDEATILILQLYLSHPALVLRLQWQRRAVAWCRRRQRSSAAPTQRAAAHAVLAPAAPAPSTASALFGLLHLVFWRINGARRCRVADGGVCVSERFGCHISRGYGHLRAGR